MKLNIIILPGGEIQILGDDAPFEETSQATNTLIAHLQARGLLVYKQAGPYTSGLLFHACASCFLADAERIAYVQKETYRASSLDGAPF